MSDKVILQTRPTPWAFFSFYAPGIYLAGLAAYIIKSRGEWFEHLPRHLPEDTRLLLFYAILGVFLIVPAAVISFLRLNLQWIVSYAAVFVSGLLLKHWWLDLPFSPNATQDWMNELELFWMLAAGCVLIIETELYRRSHLYEITSTRIHTKAGIFASRERTLFLSKLNDLTGHQSLMGKICGYGDLVPVTASGIGMGSNFAALGAAASHKWSFWPRLSLGIAAGHAIQVPKSRTYEALIGIPNVEQVKNQILALMD